MADWSAFLDKFLRDSDTDVTIVLTEEKEAAAPAKSAAAGAARATIFAKKMATPPSPEMSLGT